MYRGIISHIFAVVFLAVLCHSIGFADESSVAQTPSPDTQEAEAPSAVVDNSYNSTADQFGGYVSLYADHKARRIGDVVTIIIVESSKASKSAATQTSKKSGANGSLDDLFGLGNLPLEMGVDAASDYSGSGSTTRSGSMEAKITATVKQVLPNGNLLLEGTRQVTVNEDTQIITVSGVVRPESIGPGNSVLSTYLADAQITYVGEGPTSQRPGIVTRILQTPFHWVADVFRWIF